MDLDECYSKFLKLSADLIAEEVSPLEVAAAELAIALTIYKSTLSEEDFDRMIQEIVNSKDNVQKIDINPGTIH